MNFAKVLRLQHSREEQLDMPQRTFALFVGINDYPPGISPLTGCLNDVDQFHAALSERLGAQNLAALALKNAAATRAGVIEAFRHHLGSARVGDVAVFHYCGHGARSRSNEAFRGFFTDGMDEGLVCHDSRMPGGFDLADKELAVLVAEVAARQVEVVVVLDCCHSGSGTRELGAFSGLKPRATIASLPERPLETYVDGHYARLRDSGRPLTIASGRHILLSACERGQVAQEAVGHGIFTNALVKVLQTSGPDLSYDELFVRCRASVRSSAYEQDPQFETHQGFDAGGCFLGQGRPRRRADLHAACREGVWSVNYGALHGASSDLNRPPQFALYLDGDRQAPAGTATAVNVLPQSCELRLDFDSDESAQYAARITSVPAAPLLVAFVGDALTRSDAQRVLDANDRVTVALIDDRRAATYELDAVGSTISLRHSPRELTIASVERAYGEGRVAFESFLPCLQSIARWEHMAGLKNEQGALDPSAVELVFAEFLPDGGEYVHVGQCVTLDFRFVNGAWQGINGCIRVRHRAAQPLHFSLFYLSNAFGIRLLHNDSLAPGGQWQTIYQNSGTESFNLKGGIDDAVDRFKLIVTTEKLDDFLLTQPNVELGPISTRKRRAIAQPGRDMDDGDPVPARFLTHEWFTSDLNVRIVRQVNRVGVADVSLADGRIVIKGHPSVTADLSLGGARAGTRGVGAEADFYRALQGHGLELVGLSAGRGGPSSVLELSGIKNVAQLAAYPLRVELKIPLGEGEAILPLVYDGEHVLVCGETDVREDGVTQVSIDHIPDIPDSRRSLGGSLKLYFFKTWLKRPNVNRLCWVRYGTDGTAVREHAGVAERVSAAKRVLLLVHGIIGDTDGMVEAARECGLADQFDLVLTYDYENLNTPIAETACHLKTMLRAVGLHEDDGKALTLLVHSMGGLVSRWFIEREGGHRVVDHLVMCGTPNHGSPFGRVDQARRMAETMAVVALNYLPGLVPFAATTLLMLGRSRRLTPALEEMNPESDFLRELNGSPDPGVRYTVLAGNVANYRESEDLLFGRLLAKVGRSKAFDAMFGNQENDIAVGVKSILGLGSERVPRASLHGVDCHHLNYFDSVVGRAALRSLVW